MSSNGSLQHRFELCEGNDVIAINIVLFKNLVDFLLAQVDSELGECISEVSSGDLLLFIDIELLEERSHSLFSQVLVDWEGGCDKLVVIDKSVFIVVTLLNNRFNFFGLQINLRVFDSISEFINFDGST